MIPQAQARVMRDALETIRGLEANGFSDPVDMALALDLSKDLAKASLRDSETDALYKELTGRMPYVKVEPKPIPLQHRIEFVTSMGCVLIICVALATWGVCQLWGHG